MEGVVFLDELDRQMVMPWGQGSEACRFGACIDERFSSTISAYYWYGHKANG